MADPEVEARRGDSGQGRVKRRLTLIITIKREPYPNPNHNPNPTLYPIKPIEPYQTVLTLTDTVGLQRVLSDRHSVPVHICKRRVLFMTYNGHELS